MQSCSGGAYRPRSKRLQPTWLPLQQLFAYNCDPNLASMWCATMFEEKNSLPRSEPHFPIHNGHCLARSGQNHANVRRHVIAAFGAVREVIGVFRRNPIEEFLQVPSRSRIGVLHDDEAATGVLNKYCHNPIA